MFLPIVRVCLRLGCFSTSNFSRHLPLLDSDLANSDSATITLLRGREGKGRIKDQGSRIKDQGPRTRPPVINLK
ncbi:hypothetical protein VNO78_23863 [Psophocarpus tetragonolobus]|uniref:Uncharacterized protein n=1 Tax=Psophocarpus tetragonolobus TaxID=3891 RepID=A0AAN9S4Y0_PSOTE